MNALNPMSLKLMYKCDLDIAILPAQSGNAMTEECEIFSWSTELEMKT